jgi:hypothetical protein
LIDCWTAQPTRITFANKWNFVLRNKKEGADDAPGTMLFHQWLWSRMYDNTPYDQFVREIVTASGDPQTNPAVVWYRDVDSTEEQVEDTAQLFLGLRIQCARCHHHPFEKWSQDDYYGMAAFYGRVGKKAIPNASGTCVIVACSTMKVWRQRAILAPAKL